MTQVGRSEALLPGRAPDCKDAELFEDHIEHFFRKAFGLKGNAPGWLGWFLGDILEDQLSKTQLLPGFSSEMLQDTKDHRIQQTKKLAVATSQLLETKRFWD